MNIEIKLIKIYWKDMTYYYLKIILTITKINIDGVLLLIVMVFLIDNKVLILTVIFVKNNIVYYVNNYNIMEVHVDNNNYRKMNNSFNNI